jgi:hypothetical protein
LISTDASLPQTAATQHSRSSPSGNMRDTRVDE